MIRHRAMVFRTSPRQRGAAALMTVMFLLIVVAFAVLVSLNMSGSDVSDSAYQHNSVHALFLAASALETATYHYTVGGCGNAGIAANVTPISLGNGGYTRISATVVGANCRIRTSGTVGNVTRTVEGSITMTGGGAVTAGVAASTFGQRNANAPLNLSYTVTAGTSILLVALSSENESATVSMSYGGTPMTLAVSVVTSNSWPRAEIWYLTNPPVGTANVAASMNQTAEMVLGALRFSGVSAVTPFDVAPVTNSDNSKSTSLTITPVTNQAWVFEVLTVNSDPNTLAMATPAIPGRSLRWNRTSSGNGRGAASTIGPINPAAAVSPGWDWSASNKEKSAQAAVALQPGGGSPQLVLWTEVLN